MPELEVVKNPHLLTTHVGPKNSVFGVHMGKIWQIQLNDPWSAAMSSVATISVTTGQ